MNWSPGLERNDLHFKAIAGTLLAVVRTCLLEVFVLHSLIPKDILAKV